MTEKVFALSSSTTGVSSLSEARRIGHGAPRLREFIAGSENQLLTQLRASVTSDWGRFNPLLVNGISGTGKTHLLHCLHQDARETYSELRTVFITGADYARAIADAIDVDSLDELRDKHCAADLFILDGLHQLETKSAAQRELIRLLDFAVQHQLVVMIASLNSLDQLSGLRAELTSRLFGGLVVPLSPPQHATQLAILQRLAASMDASLSDQDLIQLVDDAPLGVTTVTDLQAAIQRLLHPPRGEQSGHLRRKELTGKLLLKTVAKQFQVSGRDLTGASRRLAVVKARAACVYLGRSLMTLSFQKLGELLGNRDHSTMMNALRRSAQFMEDDPCFKRTVLEIAETLTA